MSKAAVYAGLGQGLMALGQGAGRALEVMSLEKLRAQNLQQNWAREDARFNQEMDFRKNEASQQAEYRNQSLALQKEANEGLMNYRRDSLQLERDKLARDSAVDEMVVTEDGQKKLVKLDAQGKPISKSVISAKDAAKMDPVTKERIDLLKERYKAAMEFGAEESEISKIASELDELTGKKKEGLVSLVDGYTADQVIELFMKRNNISREQAISLARQQGRIQ